MNPSTSDLKSIGDLDAVVLTQKEQFRVLNYVGYTHAIGLCDTMTGGLAIK
jgi:hypothetical protein